MPAGEGFTASEKFEIDRAIRSAETICRYEFSVFVGTADGEPRSFARRLHACLNAPARSVLVMLDPTARALEVVTGDRVRRDLSDEDVTLSLVTMQSAFGSGDLVGGIKRGLTSLAERARKPETLHSNRP